MVGEPSKGASKSLYLTEAGPKTSVALSDRQTAVSFRQLLRPRMNPRMTPKAALKLSGSFTCDSFLAGAVSGVDCCCEALVKSLALPKGLISVGSSEKA
jgi:hypothetical protein